MLKKGGVIAYPTEAVYGIGCDPFNENAVKRVASIKNRSLDQGVLLIADTWLAAEPLVADILDISTRETIFATWPGPTTWVLPASELAPKWVRGKHQGIAIRITNHPIAKALSNVFCNPIVSTSANKSGKPPIKNFDELKAVFGSNVDFYVNGTLGGLKKPCEIRDALTGKQLRT